MSELVHYGIRLLMPGNPRNSLRLWVENLGRKMERFLEKKFNKSRTTTEMSHHSYSVRVLFMLSRSLDPVTMLKVKEEARIYQDLIVSDNPEGYSNLPLKTLSLMNYYLDNCQNSRYLLKVDDDVFVREESFQLVKNIFSPPPFLSWLFDFGHTK